MIYLQFFFIANSSDSRDMIAKAKHKVELKHQGQGYVNGNGQGNDNGNGYDRMQITVKIVDNGQDIG